MNVSQAHVIFAHGETGSDGSAPVLTQIHQNSASTVSQPRFKPMIAAAVTGEHNTEHHTLT